MSLAVRFDTSAPPSSSNPDGSIANPLVAGGTPLPAGATQLVVVATTGIAALLTGQLPGAAGRMVYITEFEITGTGATATSVITVSASGTISVQTWYVIIPAGVAAPFTPSGMFKVTFNPPLQASALGVWPQINVPSFGSGNTWASLNVRGYMI
jgi:hypothetical protein